MSPIAPELFPNFSAIDCGSGRTRVQLMLVGGSVQPFVEVGGWRWLLHTSTGHEGAVYSRFCRSTTYRIEGKHPEAEHCGVLELNVFCGILSQTFAKCANGIAKLEEWLSIRRLPKQGVPTATGVQTKRQGFQVHGKLSRVLQTESTQEYGA